MTELGDIGSSDGISKVIWIAMHVLSDRCYLLIIHHAMKGWHTAQAIDYRTDDIVF